MRKIILLAACVTSLSGYPATAQETKPFSATELLTPKVQLSPKDPKYNLPECRSMRTKAQNYSDGTLQESAGSFILGAGMPGGGAAVFAAQMRRREMFNHQVELACMSNPPDRRYLDPAATFGK